MKYVEIYKLDNDLKDNYIGKIFIKNGEITCSPLDNVNLVAIINRKVRRWPFDSRHFYDGRVMVGKEEPDVFLSSLHTNYRSGYMRVGPVKEEDVNDG